ncbi:hypothetical protein AB0E62_00345 [Streptomyces sp. NPDC038707]|uniref:hypothetical protein n=1 Tax=Streptomyces sp. NPDC038707 TaxID=3154329 RepID=UPI003404B4CD
MPNSRFYSNTAQQTTLNGSVSSGATTINVASTSGFPSSTPYTLALDYGAATEELVSVTAVSGTTLTVTRGYGGTSAQSHSLGAVVRHTYDATDASDFRTHEAATTAVHGVAGTLVGTSDTQTLSNKTLTSPTITGTVAGAHAYSGALTLSSSLTSSGGSLAGSWGGSPTFTGTPSFSTTVNFSGTQQSTLAAPTGVAAAAQVTADTFDRFRRYADGKLEWGPGTAARDTNLYRSAVDTLATDDSLSVGGALSVGTTNWTPFTPSWTGFGTGTFTINVGWYTKIGKIVFFEIYTVMATAGTGTAGVQVQFPTVPYRDGAGPNSTRQSVTGWITNSNGGVVDGVCIMPAFAGDTGTTGGAVRRWDGIPCQGNNFVSGTPIAIQGWYREA